MRPANFASPHLSSNRYFITSLLLYVAFSESKNSNSSVQRRLLPWRQWRQRRLRPLRIRRHNRLRFPRLFHSHDVLVRNFPAELLILAVLLQVLFQEDRLAGIGDERSRSGQQDVTGAVMHFDPAPQKGGISGH